MNIHTSPRAPRLPSRKSGASGFAVFIALVFFAALMALVNGALFMVWARWIHNVDSRMLPYGYWDSVLIVLFLAFVGTVMKGVSFNRD